MGSVLDFGDAARARKRGPAGAASFGLVTELVERDEPARGREGVIHMSGIATVCSVEQVPAVGDVIYGRCPGIVEDVRITRTGRVLIYAQPAVSVP
jgi:hypothetical protein